MLEPGTILTTPQAKVQLVAMATADERNDPSVATFNIQDEDHTLANVLRYWLMKNPNVEFAGYSMPHPSETCVNIRIQTDESITALDALKTAINNCKDVCQHIMEEFNKERAEMSKY